MAGNPKDNHEYFNASTRDVQNGWNMSENEYYFRVYHSGRYGIDILFDRGDNRVIFTVPVCLFGMLCNILAYITSCVINISYNNWSARQNTPR